MAQRARAVAHDVPDGRHVGSVAGDRGRAGGARMPCQDFVEAGPSDHALTIPPRQPPAPDSPYLIGEPTRTPWSGGRRPDRAISPGGARQLVASLGTPASSLHQPSAGTSACAMIAISDQMVSGQGIVICRVRAVRLQHGVCNLKPHGAALLAKLCLDLIEFLDLAGKDPTVAAVASACYPIEASAPEPCGSTLGGSPRWEQHALQCGQRAVYLVAAVIGGGPFLRIDVWSQSISIRPGMQHNPVGDGADKPRRSMCAPRAIQHIHRDAGQRLATGIDQRHRIVGGAVRTTRA